MVSSVLPETRVEILFLYGDEFMKIKISTLVLVIMLLLTNLLAQQRGEEISKMLTLPNSIVTLSASKPILINILAQESLKNSIRIA